MGSHQSPILTLNPTTANVVAERSCVTGSGLLADLANACFRGCSDATLTQLFVLRRHSSSFLDVSVVVVTICPLRIFGRALFLP